MHDSSICFWIAYRLFLFLDQENPLTYPQCNASDIRNLILIGHCMTIKLSSTNRIFFFFLNDVMIAARCSKNGRSNESMAKWFCDFGASMYIFFYNLPSQTGVCLNNGRQWKIAQKQVSLLVLQYTGIRILKSLRSIHCSRGINVSVTPFHSRFPCLPPHHPGLLEGFVVWI